MSNVVFSFSFRFGPERGGGLVFKELMHALALKEILERMLNVGR